MSPAVKAAVKAVEAERRNGTPESYEAAQAHLVAVMEAEGVPSHRRSPR